jgi:hypothetical protein
MRLDAIAIGVNPPDDVNVVIEVPNVQQLTRGRGANPYRSTFRARCKHTGPDVLRVLGVGRLEHADFIGKCHARKSSALGH